MQKSLGLFDTVAVDQNPDHADAKRIHQHRHRCRRQQQDDFVPNRTTVQNREDVGKRQDREQVSEPGTRLGDLQFIHTQVNNIAIQKHWHARERDNPDADNRRNELQQYGELPIEDLR